MYYKSVNLVQYLRCSDIIEAVINFLGVALYLSVLLQAVLIMEMAMRNYGSYENFEEITGGKILQRSQIMTLIQRYLKREELEGEILVNLSEDLLSRGSMTRSKGKAQLNVRVVNLRENWVEGLLRHEIGMVDRSELQSSI